MLLQANSVSKVLPVLFHELMHTRMQKGRFALAYEDHPSLLISQPTNGHSRMLIEELFAMSIVGQNGYGFGTPDMTRMISYTLTRDPTHITGFKNFMKVMFFASKMGHVPLSRVTHSDILRAMNTLTVEEAARIDNPSDPLAIQWKGFIEPDWAPAIEVTEKLRIKAEEKK